ncbi:MAG: enoyl-CoA hydratase-related protein [Acidimicrobiia bacterium]|nr:MAG: enoyl-CoA hydratase-related protein [Acidimicrobiia bacterium]
MELVEYSVDGAVAVITLNRPPMNALNPELISRIDTAVGRAEDPAVRAVVITGSPHFAAGADIKGFQESFDSETKDRQASGLSEAVLRLANLEKPTIAAVSGFALGGGLELAMGADFRYLAEGAKVGQPEVLLGIIPGAGGTQRLARLVGPQKCKEICITGRHVKADEALALGIADKVFPDDELLARSMEAAAFFAAGPTQAYAAIKRAVGQGFDVTLEQGLVVEAEEFAKVFVSADARIGVAAFLAKEKPEFTGS